MNDQDMARIVMEALQKVTRSREPAPPPLRPELAIADLHLDSFDALECCMEIEQRIGIELDPAELANAKNIGEMVSLIAERKRCNSAS